MNRPLTAGNTGPGGGALRFDVVAGLTAAAVVVPKAMAYATVAGLPVAVGLYTAFVPMIVYALLGSSRLLSVSSTATLAILAGTQIGLAVPDGDPTRLITAAATLTALVGLLLILAAVLRLGFVANFISMPVLTGFKAGIGLVVVLDQVPKLLGIHITKQGFFPDLLSIDLEAQRGGAALECGDISLALLFFVALLSLIDEGFAAGQHEIHHARQLVGRGGVGPRLVHAAAQPSVKRPERRVAVRQTHGGHLQRLANPVGRALGACRQNLAAADLGRRAQPSQEQKCLTLAKRERSVPISLRIFMTVSSPSPLMRVRSAPAQLASCWRTSNAARALLPVRGALPMSTLAAERSASSSLHFSSHSRKCRAMSSYIPSACLSTNRCSSRQLPVSAARCPPRWP
jgi:hypothetical protein